MTQVSKEIQRLRWRMRVGTGFRPELVSIPKRFTEITTWKGQIDSVFLNGLKDQYASAILALAAPEMNKLTESG
jgi:aldehyde:ferredoxin oxidoreductase